MIEWSHPNLLWLLLLVPALALFVWRRERDRRAALEDFAEGRLVPRLTPDVDPRRRLAREALRLLALALLVVAIAEPRWGVHWEEVKREGVDVVIALDTSRSMLATDVRPNRLDRAKLAILDLVSKLRGDRVGLVAFAGTAFLECPLTLDYGAFGASLNSTSAGIIPRGGTNLAAAIDTSLTAFEARQGKYEALILITDGESTEGDYKEAAKRATEQGVRIYTVGIGTAEGELIPEGAGGTYVKDREGQVVKSRLDEQALQDIALASGGAYVHGAGASLGLEEIFDDHIAKMERRELQSTLQRRLESRFQMPLALALVLLLLEPMLGERKRAAVAALLLGLLASPPPASADQISEGNRLYHLHKYDEAAQQYGDALIDSPASPLLRFNLAAAQYKQGKFADAVASLQKVGVTGDGKLDARVAYNLGNSLYRLGESQASPKPEEAIKSYDAALAAYKRAMGADPGDANAKVNHEVVEHKLEELKQKLEEERKKQEEQQKQQEQQQQDQAQQDQQQEKQEQQDQGQEEQKEKEQQQGGAPKEPNQSSEGEQKPQPQPGQQQEEQQGEEQAKQPAEPQRPEGLPQEAQPQQGGEAQAVPAAPSSEQDLDRQEAFGVLDTARDEEVRPDELHRLRAPAAVLEPAQDW